MGRVGGIYLLKLATSPNEIKLPGLYSSVDCSRFIVAPSRFVYLNLFFLSYFSSFCDGAKQKRADTKYYFEL